MNLNGLLLGLVAASLGKIGLVLGFVDAMKIILKKYD
jgi:hypothetical protein